MGNKSDEQEETRDEMNNQCLFQDPESGITMQEFCLKKAHQIYVGRFCFAYSKNLSTLVKIFTMNRYLKLLSIVFLISLTVNMPLNGAGTATSADIEIAINAATTRTQLSEYTDQLKSMGITLNIVKATFNSANQVMTIAFELKWSDTDTDVVKFESDNVRGYGDIWIIHNATTSCVGHCK